VRFAVHGAHLRVAREGARVVVDLSEGVIAIGPPGDGITRGTTITAPARVALDVRDPGGTLVIDRDPAAVRPPVPLSGAAERAAPGLQPASVAAERAASSASAHSSPAHAPSSPSARRVVSSEAGARAVRGCAAA